MFADLYGHCPHCRLQVKVMLFSLNEFALAPSQ
ncbi:Uncharacterised protein [Vibrio cholerae]|nr:Uncharacterised protein [Vibrio cholerae]